MPGRDLVFISFRVRESLDEARALKKALVARGYSTFVSEDDLSPGDDWPTALADNLDRAAMVVALATATYGAKGTSTQGTFEELRFAKKKNLPLVVVKMCDEWQETRTEMELGNLQCLSWTPGAALPASVFSSITDQLGKLGVPTTVDGATAAMAKASLTEVTSWNEAGVTKELQTLFTKHNIKPAVARKLVDQLGLSEAADLPLITADMVAQLGLKPLEAGALNRLLDTLRKPRGGSDKEVISVNVHPHKLELVDKESGWTCSARHYPGGCKQGCTSSADTKGWDRYRCSNPDCDFDLCVGCAKAYAGKPEEGRFIRYHPHPLTEVHDENGWACDGRKLAGGCRKGCTDYHQTTGWRRWRCQACDYDICEGCVKAHAKDGIKGC